MQIDMINPDDIRFNAAEGAFEARIRVQTATDSYTYACSVSGDIAMPLDDVAVALRTAARRNHDTTGALRSVAGPAATAPLRSVPHTDWRMLMLRTLPFAPSRQVA